MRVHAASGVGRPLSLVFLKAMKTSYDSLRGESSEDFIRE